MAEKCIVQLSDTTNVSKFGVSLSEWLLCESLDLIKDVASPYSLSTYIYGISNDIRVSIPIFTGLLPDDDGLGLADCLGLSVNEDGDLARALDDQVKVKLGQNELQLRCDGISLE